jgi:hypothetical protein
LAWLGNCLTINPNLKGGTYGSRSIDQYPQHGTG